MSAVLKKIIIGILWGACCVAVASYLDKTFVFKDEHEAFSYFQCSHGFAPESLLMDPLILAGDRMVPYVLHKIQDKNLEKRRYAIGFLGHIGSKQALPELIRIFEDTSELDYYRSDALQAIYMIDNEIGITYANRTHEGTANAVTSIIKDIRENNQVVFKKRSYWEALIGAK